MARRRPRSESRIHDRQRDKSFRWRDRTRRFRDGSDRRIRAEASEMFKGALTALITPFRDGSVDVPALRELIEWQIQSGIDGLVPCGSTGESATLSHAEHDSVIKITIEQARKRVPILAGTGSN